MKQEYPPDKSEVQEENKESSPLLDGDMGPRVAYILNHKKNDYEEAESFKGDSPESIVENRIEAAKKDITERAYEEGRKINKEEQEKVENLRKQIASQTNVSMMIDEKKAKNSKGDEAWIVPATQPSKTPWFRRAAMGAMFTLGSIFGMAKESKAAEGTAPVKKATTESVAKNTPSDSTKNTVEVYTKAKTEKGAITPTGLSNSFLENQYDVTPSDIDSLANEYGFSTRDEAAFQRDLIEYAQKNDPEIIQYVLKHFGQTDYGIKNNMAPDDYKQLLDGLLGVRAAYIMKFYKDKEQPTENKEVDPYSEYSVAGKTIYGPNNQRVGTLYYRTRETNDIKNAGNVNTAHEDAVFRAQGDFGGPTGLAFKIKGNAEHQRLFGTTDHFQTSSEEFIKVMKSIKEKEEILAKNK